MHTHAAPAVIVEEEEEVDSAYERADNNEDEPPSSSSLKRKSLENPSRKRIAQSIEMFVLELNRPLHVNTNGALTREEG